MSWLREAIPLGPLQVNSSAVFWLSSVFLVSFGEGDAEQAQVDDDAAHDQDDFRRRILVGAVAIAAVDVGAHTLLSDSVPRWLDYLSAGIVVAALLNWLAFARRR